jgi:hypothetical protein
MPGNGGPNRAAHELPEDTMIRAQEEIAGLFFES